jgi:cyclophilin family peptidyl-prolyl cis-trans isomerase
MKTFTNILLLIIGLAAIFLLTRHIAPTQETITQNESMKAILETNKGTITVELWADKAPKTVSNFQELAATNFYDGVKFHRVINGFMIQTGDPLSKDETQEAFWGTGGPGYTFEDEIHDSNENTRGTLAMANAGPDTNGSQFFINTVDNEHLNGGHTVFGKVIDGMDVVEAIESVETLPNDRPVEPVEIISITINNN